MAKIIDINIDNKSYMIEFDRSTVAQYVMAQENYDGDTNDVKKVVDILRCGLMKHHAKEMPSDNELVGWLVAFDDVQGLFNAISELVQDVLNSVEKTRKEGNATWGLRK